MKGWSLFELVVGLLVVAGLGTAIYYMLTFHTATPHQWQPHEVIAVAVVIAAYLLSSSIKDIASALKEIARAIQQGKGSDF